MTRSFHLNHTHFAAMLAVALAVHLVMGVVWALSPGLKINKIPVHVLNIKLGSGAMDMIDLNSQNAAKESFTTIATQPNVAPPPHENERTTAPAAPKKKPAALPKAKKADEANKATALKKGAPNRGESIALSSSASTTPLSSDASPSQFVRRDGNTNGAGVGSAVGNAVDPQADIMQRYTQLISMWINRHRDILNRALQPGMKGNVVIRLRIDRRGYIHYFKLDKATGVPGVDAAAAEMVRAANPVPPVPSNYPGGNMFEFLIPVGYTFQQ